ncbi:MAG: glycoside hydrolase [Tannerella sp.]|jgi:alpha-L-arabinofuranosidase|nr:glycoside hydrolase [Tannerella sp.]
MTKVKTKYKIACLLSGLLMQACKPVPPVTSSIVIDLEKPTVAVNRELYGLTLEEINHAIEGGLCAELIRNGSFETGVIPDGCSYDPFTNSLTTPSGWQVPFVSPNAIPGWRILNEQTSLFIDTWSRPLNEANQRSLWVYVPYQARGGVVAEGFGSIPVRKGERYDLSLFIRGQRHSNVRVELRDSMAGRPLSETFLLEFTREWQQVRHTFTATENDPYGTLVFSLDSSVLFNLDMVSLYSSDTKRARFNGLRTDLTEALEALNPQFVRFPGGASVEGYASSAVPAWEETLAPVELRRPLWSMYGYGTGRKTGFHEYLQICEDLQATPVYVASAGLLNQRYHTRYQDQPVENRAEQIRTALAYANEPVDSLYGRMRQAHGHAAPFNLSRVEIGSEHRGREYLRRYRQLREAVQNPDVSLICNSLDGLENFDREWVDTHYNTDVDFLIAGHDCFDLQSVTLQTPMQFIGEFGASYAPEAGTLRAAVGEAAFLIGAERNPANVKGIAYSPLLGHAGFPLYGTPAILFDAWRMAKSPSCHVWEMFAGNRGDDLLTTVVRTYNKPLVRVGAASVILYDYQFGVKDLAWNSQPVQTAFVKDNRTNYKWNRTQPVADEQEVLSIPEEFDFEEEQQKVVETHQVSDAKGQPTDVLRRYMIFGDSTIYNYSVSMSIKEVQAGGMFEIHVRDNGLVEEQADYISLTFKEGKATLYHCGGYVSRPLAGSAPVNFSRDEWHRVEIICNDQTIRCYLDRQLLIDAVVPSCPSLLTVATHERETGSVILKVVNTTFHEEWCSLDMLGGNFSSEIEMIQLTGFPDGRNTLEAPDAIVPRKEKLKFSFSRPLTYAFPANSVTVLRLAMK